MKKNQKMIDAQGRERSVGSLFKDLKMNKKRILRRQRWVGNQLVWLSGMKLDTGELLLLAGNERCKYSANPFTCYLQFFTKRLYF
jgi:hypothetical protein